MEEAVIDGAEQQADDDNRHGVPIDADILYIGAVDPHGTQQTGDGNWEKESLKVDKAKGKPNNLEVILKILHSLVQ
jgi:hypothetical protein